MEELNGRLINTNNITDIALDDEKLTITIWYNEIKSTRSYEDRDCYTITDYEYRKEVLSYDESEEMYLKYEFMKRW